MTPSKGTVLSPTAPAAAALPSPAAVPWPGAAGLQPTSAMEAPAAGQPGLEAGATSGWAQPAAASSAQHTPEPIATAGGAEPAATAAQRAEGHAVSGELHGLQGTAVVERQAGAAASMAASQEDTAAAAAAAAGGQARAAAATAPPQRRFVQRERAVPSTAVGRVLGFAQLGTSLLYGTMREGVSRALGGRRAEDRCAAGRRQPGASAGWLCRVTGWWALPSRPPQSRVPSLQPPWLQPLLLLHDGGQRRAAGQRAVPHARRRAQAGPDAEHPGRERAAAAGGRLAAHARQRCLACPAPRWPGGG